MPSRRSLSSSQQATLSHGGFNHQVNAASVSPSFFVTVGGAMRSGRAFTSEELSSIVISDRLRRRLFGEEEAIGRTLVLGKPDAVVESPVARFRFPPRIRTSWLPASGSNCCPYAAVARLKPAVSLEQASADVQAMLPLFAATSPRVYAGARGSVIPLREELAGDVRRPLLVFSVWSACCSASRAPTRRICWSPAMRRGAKSRFGLRWERHRRDSGASHWPRLLSSRPQRACSGIALTVGVIDALLWLPLEGVGLAWGLMQPRSGSICRSSSSQSERRR